EQAYPQQQQRRGQQPRRQQVEHHAHDDQHPPPGDPPVQLPVQRQAARRLGGSALRLLEHPDRLPAVPQLAQQFLRRGGSLLQRLVQQPQPHRLQLRIDRLGAALARRQRRRVENLVSQLGERRSGERHPPGQQAVGDHAQRPQVR